MNQKKFNDLNNKYINYRPVSFSEANLDDLKKNLLLKNDIQNNDSISVGIQTDIQIDFLEIIFNKLILFFVHLFLIAMFELIFFFNFVTKYEDKALIDVFNQMTNQATSICSTLTKNDKLLVNNFLSFFINTTKINQEASLSYDVRFNYNYKLLMKAIYYIVFIGGLNTVIILMNYLWFKRKINYKTIIIDNLVMIIFLGLFEYLFFSTIVFNYQTISSDELNKQISKVILENC